MHAAIRSYIKKSQKIKDKSNNAVYLLQFIPTYSQELQSREMWSLTIRSQRACPVQGTSLLQEVNSIEKYK